MMSEELIISTVVSVQVVDDLAGVHMHRGLYGGV